MNNLIYFECFRLVMSENSFDEIENTKKIIGIL